MLFASGLERPYNQLKSSLEIPVHRKISMSFWKKLMGPKEGPPEKARNMSRNAACWCGSGQKYKQCHLEKDRGFFTAAQNEACKGPT